MKSHSLLVVSIALTLMFFRSVEATEIPIATPVAKIMRHGNIKKIKIKVGSEIKEITLPGHGAQPRTFAIATEKFGNWNIISIILDERGQVPSIAYYQIDDGKICFIGEYSHLIFDVKNNLVVEPLHSSAAEQIINRYDLHVCALGFYDQLSDRAIIDDDAKENSVKRVVSRLKGKNGRKFECGYSIEHGEKLDPNNCFQR